MARAATAEPSRLSAIAVRMTIPQIAYSVPPEISVSVVRSPVNTKKSGSSRTTIASPRRTVSASTSSGLRGTSAPAKYAPNAACRATR
jgi:hypothetical protein